MAIYTQEKLDEMVDARTRIGMGGNPVKITIDGNSTEYGPGNISLLNKHNWLSLKEGGWVLEEKISFMKKGIPK